VTRIDDLVATLCPSGVPLKELGEVGEFIRGRRFTKADYVESGMGAIHYGEIYTDYGTATAVTRSFVRSELKSSLRLARRGDLVIAATGENIKDVCKAVAWIGDAEVAIHDDCYIFRHRLEPKYVSYFFQSSAFQGQKVKFVSESKVVRVSGSSMAKVRMPIPPPEVQREIVRALDAFESLEAGLQAELQARRRQYTHYRDALVNFSAVDGTRWVALGEISTVRVGQPPPPKVLDDRGAFPYVNAGTTASGLANEANTPAGTVTIPSRGQGGVGVVGYQSAAFWCGPLCYRIKSKDDDVAIKFLYYFLKSVQVSIRALQQTGGTPALNRKELVLVRVPVPAREEQERIVAILDKFDALVNDLSIGLPAELNARRKQYEHYRDRLLTFPEAA
jgi:type I restriction enzyme S subunit